jgi:hypothetical protein
MFSIEVQKQKKQNGKHIKQKVNTLLSFANNYHQHLKKQKLTKVDKISGIFDHS